MHIWFAISTKVIVPSSDIIESGAITLAEIGIFDNLFLARNALPVHKCKVKKIIPISLLFNVYIECIPCPKGTEKNTKGCSPCRAISTVVRMHEEKVIRTTDNGPVHASYLTTR